MLPIALRVLLLSLAAHAGSQLSERELQEAMDEGAEFVKAQTVEKDFVIVKSTPDYRAAVRAARDAARQLGVRLDLRSLSPHAKGGLTFPKKDCEESAFEYPCYVARGRDDDGAYVSVEYSTAYAGFRPSLYIVVAASDSQGGQIAKDALKAARKVFKDAYARRTGVYMGCMH
jgi:hypothetical protein